MGGRALILLDTHVLVWLDRGDPALGAKSRKQADAALQEEGLAISAISFWEIAMLVQKKRLTIHQPLDAWRRDLFDLGLTEIPPDGAICLAAGEFEDDHGDPADRIILATALRVGAILMTADERLLDWSGKVQRQDARH